MCQGIVYYQRSIEYNSLMQALSPTIQGHLNHVLDHLYINPLEKCNLACKICYTRKTSPILTKEEILAFIDRYQKEHPLKTITFCGGEVCALAYFPALVNELTTQGIFVQMITNGTIDILEQFEQPNSINLIVSLDGLPTYHDANRGEGNFAKSSEFLKKGHALGFHTEVFSIVTKQNFGDIDAFEAYLEEALGFSIQVTYHPRKPPEYLSHHPVSNIVGETDGFDFLDEGQMRDVMENRRAFPPKNLGCYQIALVSDGRIFGCCEGVTPIGHIDDPVQDLFDALEKRIAAWEQMNTLRGCLGCSQPEFMCGIKRYLLPLERPGD